MHKEAESPSERVFDTKEKARALSCSRHRHDEFLRPDRVERFSSSLQAKHHSFLHLGSFHGSHLR